MMRQQESESVFKIAAKTAWQDACREGAIRGSADDLRDGFIHLSAQHQLAGTLERHFTGQADLVLISFASKDLGSALKWEPSRNGDCFPHLYAVLPTAAARTVYALTLDANGVPEIPADVTQC